MHVRGNDFGLYKAWLSRDVDAMLRVSESVSKLTSMTELAEKFNRRFEFDQKALASHMRLAEQLANARIMESFHQAESALNSKMILQASQVAALASRIALPSDVVKALSTKGTIDKLLADMNSSSQWLAGLEAASKSYKVSRARLPLVEALGQSVKEDVDLIEQTEPESVDSLLETKLAEADTEEPLTIQPEGTKPFRITRKQRFYLAWLVVIVLSIPYLQHYSAEKGREAAFSFALNVAASLVVLMWLEGRKEED